MKEYLCPIEDCTCPYYSFKDGHCEMFEEGYSPVNECETFYDLVEEEIADLEI